EERLAVLEGLREPNRAVAPVEERLEPLTPVAQRQADERLALDLEHVEGLVDDRRPRLRLLHRREARPALLVERADLAVEDAVRRLGRLRKLLRDVREPRRQIVPVAADEARLAATHVGKSPVAVPLDLEEPTGALRHLLLERREHRGILAAALRRRGAVLALLEQEPVLGVAVELRRHERPHP